MYLRECQTREYGLLESKDEFDEGSPVDGLALESANELPNRNAESGLEHQLVDRDLK